METKDKKYKKESIPKALKDAIWCIWIGENIGKTKCMCCEIKEITQSSFECGHVDAEVNGGKLSPINLRPICGVCNKSMGTQNMGKFKEYCGFGKVETLYIKADGIKIIKEKEIVENKTEKVSGSHEIFEEKRYQEYLFLQKVDSKYRKNLQRMIVEYDLKHSPLKILKEFYNNTDKMLDELRKMLVARELFLIKVTNEINSS